MAPRIHPGDVFRKRRAMGCNGSNFAPQFPRCGRCECTCLRAAAPAGIGAQRTGSLPRHDTVRAAVARDEAAGGGGPHVARRAILFSLARRAALFRRGRTQRACGRAGAAQRAFLAAARGRSPFDPCHLPRSRPRPPWHSPVSGTVPTSGLRLRGFSRAASPSAPCASPRTETASRARVVDPRARVVDPRARVAALRRPLRGRPLASVADCITRAGPRTMPGPATRRALPRPTSAAAGGPRDRVRGACRSGFHVTGGW